MQAANRYGGDRSTRDAHLLTVHARCIIDTRRSTNSGETCGGGLLYQKWGYRMTQQEVETLVASLEDVEREEAFGYTFFFVGDDHRLPFVTLANSDHDFDRVSNLDRDGVFRINIGVSRETFDAMVADRGRGDVDYSVLDVFLPHPDYAAQNWLCILSPTGDNVVRTRRLIAEAHDIAAARYRRRSAG